MIPDYESNSYYFYFLQRSTDEIIKVLFLPVQQWLPCLITTLWIMTKTIVLCEEWVVPSLLARWVVMEYQCKISVAMDRLEYIAIKEVDLIRLEIVYRQVKILVSVNICLIINNRYGSRIFLWKSSFKLIVHEWDTINDSY